MKREVIYRIEQLDNGIVLRQEEDGFDPTIECEKYLNSDCSENDKAIIRFLGKALFADVRHSMDIGVTNKIKIKLTIENEK